MWLGKPYPEQGHVGAVKVGPTGARVVRLRHVATYVPDKWLHTTEPRLSAYSYKALLSQIRLRTMAASSNCKASYVQSAEQQQGRGKDSYSECLILCSPYAIKAKEIPVPKGRITTAVKIIFFIFPIFIFPQTL